MNQIPLVDLSIQNAQVAAEVEHGMADVVAAGRFILGREVQEFEQGFAEFSGVAHCAGVANGTDALELLLRAVGIGPGDEVILPANTFVATALAITRAGATPVFVDCDPEYQLITGEGVEQKLGPKVKAVMAVHLFGQIAPMEDLQEAIGSKPVLLLEDCAQAHGAIRNGKAAGSWGPGGATSFYPGKNLGAYGDAGAVITDSEEVVTKVKSLRNYGSALKYQHNEMGFNSRLDTLQAVVLLAKLKLLSTWNDQRKAAADAYSAALAGEPRIRLLQAMPGNHHVWNYYPVRVGNRDRVLGSLHGAGIGAGIHYPIPIHLLEAFSFLGMGRGDFPNSEDSADTMISLPIYPGITPAQQQRVVEVLLSAL